MPPTYSIQEEARIYEAAYVTRRLFFKDSLLGLGSLALGSMLGSCNTNTTTVIERDPIHPFQPRAPHFAPRAKSVIYLHMAGAPSQLELFDYKPELMKLDGQSCPPSLLQGKKFAFIRGVPTMLGPQARFTQKGNSGAWVSDYLTHFGEVVDEVSFLKAVQTDQFNHGPAQLLMHTGSARAGRPSIGSWATYGLGSENNNLPGFVVLTSGGRFPDAGKSVWGSGFLPSVYQGVQCRSEGDPVLFLQDPSGISRDIRKASIEAINQSNAATYSTFQDPEIISRMAQYELAFRMQMAVPDVMNINDEPDYIHELYGSNPAKPSLANNILLARKLVEKGVRFVQLYDWGWDSHGTSEDGAIDYGFINKCKTMDKPVAALLLDLKQRGLLEETLVVWGGEFGRTPMQENRDGKQNPFKGRDHHTEAFTMWMAGGGINAGISYGETDEIGYSAISGKTTPFDMQATILHLLGFDHEKFTYPFQGRPFRLTDVQGKVIAPFIA